jgi:hypothetical protein
MRRLVLLGVVLGPALLVAPALPGKLPAPAGDAISVSRDGSAEPASPDTLPAPPDGVGVAPRDNTDLAKAPPPKAPKLTPAGPYRGTVTEITKDSITIRGLNYTISGLVTRVPTPDGKGDIVRGNPLTLNFRYDGHKVTGVSAVVTPEAVTVTSATGEVTTLRADQAVLRFRLSEALAAGEIPRYLGIGGQAFPPYLYRITDVQVGDRIQLVGQHWDGVPTCNGISIERRPGGKVPPCPGEEPDVSVRHHERMNAAQAREEKASPTPGKSDGLRGRRDR